MNKRCTAHGARFKEENTTRNFLAADIRRRTQTAAEGWRILLPELFSPATCGAETCNRFATETLFGGRGVFNRIDRPSKKSAFVGARLRQQHFLPCAFQNNLWFNPQS